jgi:hypothetical protein
MVVQRARYMTLETIAALTNPANAGDGPRAGPSYTKPRDAIAPNACGAIFDPVNPSNVGHRRRSILLFLNVRGYMSRVILKDQIMPKPGLSRNCRFSAERLAPSTQPLHRHEKRRAM